ncbi:MAG: EF-hand domain-containing protein [Candidatus Sericytochromatia bacterium]
MKTMMTMVIGAMLLAGCGQRALVGVPSATAVAATSAQSLFGADRELKRVFDAVDANHNGKITFQELMDAPTGQPLGGWVGGEKELQGRTYMAKCDTNKDGQISFKEYKAGHVGQAFDPNQPSAETMAIAREIFNKIDADHDGELTPAELMAAPTGQPAGGYAPGQKEAELDALMTRFDTDRNGSISFAEYKAGQTGSAAKGQQ